MYFRYNRIDYQIRRKAYYAGNFDEYRVSAYPSRDDKQHCIQQYRDFDSKPEWVHSTAQSKSAGGGITERAAFACGDRNGVRSIGIAG